MIYSIIGLILDLIGVLLLFKYGILPDNLWQHLLMDNGMSELDEKKHKIWSKIAILFLILGFALQLAGTISNKQNSFSLFETSKTKNLNLGKPENKSKVFKSYLKLKYDENKVFYILGIKGKKIVIDSIHNFKIDLQDNDGFKIDEIIVNNFKNDNLSQTIDKDSATIEVRSTILFEKKKYSEIKRWSLLSR